MQVHIDRNGERYGPYSIEDINAYLANGTLLPTDLAWQDGMTDWLPVSQISGVVMPEGSVAAPAPPSQPVSNGNKKKILIGIGAGMGLLALGVGIWFFFIRDTEEKGQFANNDGNSAPEQSAEEEVKEGEKETPPTKPTTEKTRKTGTTLEFARQPFLGIYEYSEDNRDWVYRFVLKEDGRYQSFANGLEMEGGTWKVVGKEVHVLDHQTDIWAVYIANANGDLTGIASIQRGDREDYPTKDQDISKKIKTETPLKTFKAPKEEDVVGTYTRKYKDEEGAEILEKKIFRENGLRDRYVNAEKAEYTYPGVPTPVAKWKIKGSEIWVTHVFTTIYKLEQNGDLTEVGGVFFGQLTPHTIKERTTYKKIK